MNSTSIVNQYNTEVYEAIQNTLRECKSHLEKEPCESCHIFTCLVDRIDTFQGIQNMILFPFEINMTEFAIQRIVPNCSKHDDSVKKVIEYAKQVVEVIQLIYLHDETTMGTINIINPSVKHVYVSMQLKKQYSILQSTDSNNIKKFNRLVHNKIEEYHTETYKLIQNNDKKIKILYELFHDIVDTPFGLSMIQKEPRFKNVICEKLDDYHRWYNREVYGKYPEIHDYMMNLYRRVHTIVSEPQTPSHEVSQPITTVDQKITQESPKSEPHLIYSEKEFAKKVSDRLEEFTLNEEIGSPQRRLTILTSLFRDLLDTPYGLHYIHSSQNFKSSVINRIDYFNKQIPRNDQESIDFLDYVNDFHKRITKQCQCCNNSDTRKRISLRNSRKRNIPSCLDGKEVFIDIGPKYTLYWADYCNNCKKQHQDKYGFYDNI